MNKKHKKQKPDWNKEELDHLYWDEGMTLQKIGDLFGVTRERVRQKMRFFSIPSRERRACQFEHPHRRPYANLEDYLARGADRSSVIHRFLPTNIACSECGSKKHIHVHHVIYLARELKDIQILCKSCHFMKHRTGISYIQQIDIYNAYSSGITTLHLSEKYRCSRINIYKIITKIRNSNRVWK